MTATISVPRYDDALPIFVKLVDDHMGHDALDKHAFLRDADGTLTLILRQDIDSTARTRLESAVLKILGSYAAKIPVATPSDLFDSRLADPRRDQFEFVRHGDFHRFVRLVERRIVGQDWLRGIQPEIPDVPPIVVFASHKGGVGRSTALSVACAEFAFRGKSILAVDLDLEAPGLGGMFLPIEHIPTFGALDYYVESSHAALGDDFLDNMTAVSPLPQGQGRVMIVPAVGNRCHDFPQNVIGKLSRAYLEGIDEHPPGEPLTFLDRTRSMVRDLAQRGQYDAIFLDARAGLNETTAATIQGLGADVLFFGIDVPQTWEGYRYFLAHLARFKPTADEGDWRYRLKMVHAKAAADPRAWSIFRDRAFELFAEHLYDEQDASTDANDLSFSFDLDDHEAPHYAWPIIVDPTYFEFDPISRAEQFMEPIYVRTFGAFLSGLSERLKFS